jgi:HlyD family secretion protein
VKRRLVLIAAGGAGVMALAGAVAVDLVARRSTVPTARARRENFVVRVTCEGTLRAAQATPITVPGDVERPLNVAWIAEDGSRVKAGAVIARFDPTQFETALIQGESQRSTADEKIKKAEIETAAARRGFDLDAEMAAREAENARTFASRDAEIYSRFEIIESEIDASLAAARQEHADGVRATKEKVARNDLALLGIEKRKADLEISQARRGLAALQVTAPHDGILVLQRDWRGNVPRVGDTVWRGFKLGEIPRLEAMEADVLVLEADAGELAVGQKAEVFLEAQPKVAYEATVRQVDTLARPRLRGSPLQYFGAVLAIAGSRTATMKPGQRVLAVLTLAQRSAAVVIPRQAVFDTGGGKTVYRKKRWGGFESREVKLGPAALGRVVVEEGLAAGDVVALVDPTRPQTSPTRVQPQAAPRPGGGA